MNKTEARESISAAIRQGRKEKHLTQHELAAAIEQASNGRFQYTDWAISAWERGKGLPDADALLCVFHVLGLEISDIYKKEESRLYYALMDSRDMTNAPDTRLERIEEIYAELNEEGRKSLLKSAEMHYSFIEFKE